MAWTLSTRRISERDDGTCYHHPLQTRSSYPAWPGRCSRRLNPQWCQRHPPWLALVRLYLLRWDQRVTGATEEIISEEAPSSQSLKVRLPLGLLKRSHETSGSGSKSEAEPSKVRKEPEAEEGKIGGPTGPSKADLSEAHFELYQKDHAEVRDIRVRILKLNDRDDVTQEVLDSSPVF